MLHDWLKKFVPFFIQSQVKMKPIVTCSHSFSRASLVLNFDWFIGLSAAFLIGYSGFVGFGALTSLLQVFVWFGGNMKNYIWTHNGLIVRVMDSGPSGWGSSPGRGHCVVFLVEQDTLLSQCLSPPRCINGYQRI